MRPRRHSPGDRRCRGQRELGVKGFCRDPRGALGTPLLTQRPQGRDRRSPISSGCLTGLSSSPTPSLPRRLPRPQGLCTRCPPPTAWTPLSLGLCRPLLWSPRSTPVSPQGAFLSLPILPVTVCPTVLPCFIQHDVKPVCRPHSLPASPGCGTPGRGLDPRLPSVPAWGPGPWWLGPRQKERVCPLHSRHWFSGRGWTQREPRR